MWVFVPLALLVLPAAVSAITVCGGNFTIDPGSSKEITLPVGSDGTYRKGLRCTYIFNSPDYRASFLINCPRPQFNISQTIKKCSYKDYLLIDDNSTLFDYYCGWTKPEANIMTGGPYLHMKFKSNYDNKSGRGFTCVVQALLDETYTTTTSAPANIKKKIAPQPIEYPEVFVPPRGYKCNCGTSRTTRGLDGIPAIMGANPWAGALLSRGAYEPTCTTVTINDRYVLTSQECVESISNQDLQVRFNEYVFSSVSRGITRDVTVTATDGKLAILALAYPINLGSKHAIQPVCLLDVDVDLSATSARVSGWGTQDSTMFHTTVLNSGDYGCPYGDIAPCGMETKLCEADAGGPVVVDKEGTAVLVGIVGGRTSCDDTQDFIDISSRYQWIIANTQDATYCNEQWRDVTP